jgi:hypothetical protein
MIEPVNVQLYYAELLKNSYLRDFVPNEEQILLKINGNNIGSLQNYAIISGLPKSGKSTFTTSIVASNFNDEGIFGIKLQTLPERRKVCYIDTESSLHDFYSHMNRIKKISNLKVLPSDFDAFCLRKEEPLTIKNMIDAYLLNTPQCSVIIIDGLLDLCMNYNDEVECRKVVNWLKHITTVYNLFIIGILHTGKRDGQTLGHLGSNTDRWAQSTLEVKKDEEGCFELTPRFLRSSKNFEPLKIKYDEFEMQYSQVFTGMSEINNKQKKDKDYTKYLAHEHDILLNNIFKLKKELAYDDLIKEICKHDNRGINSTKGYIKFMKEKNIIDKNELNFYYDARISF